MKRWLGGIRGTILMVLTWTVGWGLGFGGLIEAFIDPHGAIEDVWLTVMAVPGFIGGALFSGLLRVAEGRRSFAEVSLVRAALWGAVTGVALGALGVARGLTGPSPRAALAMIATAAALGVVAAIGSVVLFRLLARGGSPADAPRPVSP
jgi:hypothetical protein